ncbi:MAG: SDR family NAD(P)-dependent oxidoreductase [Candidatus Omnitrophota bacterium]|nr:SDR family NAD(P)-dependent oxidoreductase [Candidatus Omnitrophota bacterium]
MKVLITGGAGFVGCNLAQVYLEKGHEVIVLDDLSRKGTRKNLNWLETIGRIVFFRQDIRDFRKLKKTIEKCGEIDVIYHMAAQVAVTTSVADPRSDFDANALGTFNLLEAVRQSGKDPVIVFASTNKVYGEMMDLKVALQGGKYQYTDMPQGVSESRQLDFHSPYGCSKGCADQYVVDYSRIYGMRTVCMRQSCIYGPRQFGVEDQGWVAWFTIAAALGRPLTIYGDGKQVRDILHVRDLIELFQKAYDNIENVKGMAFNVGGGTENQMSLLELIDFLEKRTGKKIKPSFDDWRPGDQKIYVSDIRKVKEHLGWEPRIGKEKGVEMLWEWVNGNKDLFKGL